ncbi:hypothetical protein F8388_000563 [Cannabis sativa]|uniref:CCHC-type domain-containing protein n=1 Tax=Cannabis sativa TaxID=3483 RepID=A0A7J6F2T8_CANSA|nr:hypothetical protein F8388_000563 [Cannabis sativa]
MALGVCVVILWFSKLGLQHLKGRLSSTFCSVRGLVGRVVKVDLNEENPATWGKFLKVLVDVEVEKPLFSGCFFDVASGVKKWIQVKYEKIGIFCYFCGCLGHQRRGCKLTSPMTVSNSDGILFPMFGPWLSTLSSYPSVFSGPTVVASRGFSPSSTVRKNGGALLSLTASKDGGDVEQRGSPASLSFRSRCPAMETSHGADGLGMSKRALWLPKNRLPGAERSLAISGFDGEAELLRDGNRSDDIPILERNRMDHEHLNCLTVDVDKRDIGLCASGPTVIKDGLAIQQKGKGKSPIDQNSNLSNSVCGPPIFSNGSVSCGPQLVGSRDINISTNVLEGPSIGGNVSIANGPNSSPRNLFGLVGGRSSLPSASNGPEEQSNEDKALAQFFKAQESLLHGLKHFGNLDLYEIQKIGGDIGVPTSSEVNERTTPFKKRKFEASASLCSRPHKVPRKYPDVVRDFPWDTTHKTNDSNLAIEDPSEDSSSSPSCSSILKNPLVGSFVIDDTASSSLSFAVVMDLVNATNLAFNGQGRCLSRVESTISLTPSASSQQILSSLCLVGKVIAPMTVNEDTVREFVVKTWKFQVNVVALFKTTNIPNSFELGFARVEDRAWACDNGPWCVRGYSFILKAWCPKKALSGSFDSTRIWIQIHNLPRDYFSVENGKLLGGKAGKVIKVELDEGNPASWSKFLKILIELNVNLPLFSGCFFELESGGHSWIQFKYERLGIFCYNCGILGHQRRGCPLSSPVTVANDVGIPYPLFGPWLSVASSYLDVFAGANSFSPSQDSSSRVGRGANWRLPLPSAMAGGRRSLYRPTMVGRGSKQMVKATGPMPVTGRLAVQKAWMPKKPAISRQPGVSSMAQVDGLIKEDIGPAFSSSGPTNTFKEKAKCLGVSAGPCKVQEKACGGAGPLTLKFCTDQEEGTDGDFNVGQDANGPLCRAKNFSGNNSIMGNLDHGPANSTNSNESSICGQEVNFHHDENLALTNFFQAQGTLLEELKKFGNLDLYEIKSIGGDIGVPTASEVNERTTPYKKRKFDEASASLCSRPWKLLRPHPWAIRDFPWDSEGHERKECDLI